MSLQSNQRSFESISIPADSPEDETSTGAYEEWKGGGAKDDDSDS